uniref:Uncharacterized protein n=1 Tax=Oryza meridionalis TaxID=40149 RepID=A0A0E0EA82_9ORYZ
MLKVMTFRVGVRLSKKWLSNQRRLLRLREKLLQMLDLKFHATTILWIIITTIHNALISCQ